MLCISLESLQASIAHGQFAEWAVDVWAVNGDIPDTTVRLATGTKSLEPSFSFGCGNFDGTASCNLGGVFSGSTARQVIASVTVPATDTAVTSVKLTATASAAGLSANPSAAIAVPVRSGTATGTPAGPAPAPGTGTSTGPGSSSTTVSSLPVGSLPTIGSGSPTSSLSPGGNAAGLFPTINSSGVPAPTPGQGESARPVADSAALPIGTPVIDGQLLGLGALGIAFLLAVTRLSVRRRPAAAATAGGRGAVVEASAAPVSTARTSTARTSAAWTSAESAKDEAASAGDSIPGNVGTTATANEAPAGEAVRATPAADDLAGSVDDTEIIEAISPGATANPSGTGGEPETDDGE
jgi:hypothetical protein